MSAGCIHGNSLDRRVVELILQLLRSTTRFRIRPETATLLLFSADLPTLNLPRRYSIRSWYRLRFIRMSQQLITRQDDFRELCEDIEQAGIVAFDTEFVSDTGYRPLLCLLQFAIGGKAYAVDPLAIDDLSAWWSLMADDKTTVVVHGGQAEIRFCLDHYGQAPRRIIDIQLAEGLRSRSYPLAYTNLVRRVIGKQLSGKQTRTDWSRRPLSDKQLHYALEDVLHVLPVWRRQEELLTRMKRIDWALDEFDRMVREIEADLQTPPWQRVNGFHRLSRTELGVAIELADWREEAARQRDKQSRRVLRDDLLLDLCRRQPKNERELLTTRDMNRPQYKKSVAELLECIRRGLEADPNSIPTLPVVAGNDRSKDEEVVGKLLALALANRCAELDVSMQLVATVQELKHLVRIHVHGEDVEPRPRLLEGWRSDVCGNLLIDVLEGRIAIRVADAASQHPLVFERRDT